MVPPEAAGVQGRQGGLGLEELQRSLRASSKQDVLDPQQPGPNAAAGSYYLSATWEEDKAREETVSPQVGAGPIRKLNIAGAPYIVLGAGPIRGLNIKKSSTTSSEEPRVVTARVRAEPLKTPKCLLQCKMIFGIPFACDAT